MRNTYRTIVMLLLLGLPFLDASALSEYINLDISIKSWDRVVIIVGYIDSEIILNARTNVRVDKILYGQDKMIGKTVPIRFSLHTKYTKPGTYVLILEWDNDSLISCRDTCVLGDIVNTYVVKDKDDPIINDIQVVIDTATISNNGLKYERIKELLTTMRQRTFVFTYALTAEAEIINEYIKSLKTTLYFIVRDPNIQVDNIIFADKLLIGIPIQQMNDLTNIGGVLGEEWKKSDERKRIFIRLGKKDDLSKEQQDYINSVLQSFIPDASSNTNKN